jgi:DNA-binding CsgD family transcriptional regulator
MATTIDRAGELTQALRGLGIGVLELLASIPDPILVLDRQQRVVAILGGRPDESSRRPEDLVGRTFREAFGGQMTDVHEAANRRALEGEGVVYEWTSSKGRQPMRLCTAVSPLRNSSSKIVGLVLLTRNITPVRRGESLIETSIAQQTKRLLELEEGIRQLAGVVENHRKGGPARVELGADNPLRLLSARERQVLDLLGQGYRPRSIAETLHLSPDTVRNHLKAMFKKTGTHSQEELTALLRASGSA